MILIIELDESTRMALKYLMLSWGLEATIVSNVTEGLAQLECAKFSIILIDTGFKEKVSSDFIDACHIKCPQSRIVIMSTMCPRMLQAYADSCGVNDFIGKPFEMDNLAHMLGR